MVRLKAENDLEYAIRELSFNSTMVRLKVEYDERQDEYESRFNSTMVRLKVEADRTTVDPRDAFQFHNGSIKSQSR